MTRLARLSARDYQRISPELRQAVDVLLYGTPDAASRGQQKTILGWKRTAEETAAYARKLIAEGMMPGAAALRLGVSADHLRRLFKEVQNLENRPRKPSIHAEESGLTGKAKGVGHPPPPHPDPGRVIYSGDPFTYDFKAAFGRALSRASR
jgi:hypothetical protein